MDTNVNERNRNRWEIFSRLFERVFGARDEMRLIEWRFFFSLYSLHQILMWRLILMFAW